MNWNAHVQITFITFVLACNFINNESLSMEHISHIHTLSYVNTYIRYGLMNGKQRFKMGRYATSTYLRATVVSFTMYLMVTVVY